MANPEHLEILRQEVEKWNKWRGKNHNPRVFSNVLWLRLLVSLFQPGYSSYGGEPPAFS